jgi:phosphoglycolate phosphatase-like HAD superfamily hydrolase
VKLFVWDLHGTLEQGNENASIELSNLALAQMGYAERFTSEHSRALYGLKWHEYFAHLLPHEPHSRHLALQALGHAIALKDMDIIKKHIRPATHSLDVLQRIKNAGHDQILISNTDPEALRHFVRILGLEQYFDPTRALGADMHLKNKPTSKENLLRDYLVGKNYEGVIIIGDSGKDMLLKTVAGGTTYLYAHPGYPFRSDTGDFQTNDLRHVLQEL